MVQDWIAMGGDESGRNRGFWGFWSSLPGVLTGLAALIAAVAGMAQLLKDDGGSSTPEPSGGTLVRPDSSSPAESQPAPEPGTKGFKVTGYELSGPSPGQGETVPCPHKVSWNATISVVGTGTVRYGWFVVGSGGTKEGTVSFQHSDFEAVPITLTVPGSSGDHVKGDIGLKILSPRTEGGAYL